MLSKVDEIVDTGEEIQKSVHPSVFDSAYVHGYFATVGVAVLVLAGIAANIVVMDEMVPTVYLAALLVVPGAMLVRNGIRRRMIMYHFTDRQIIEEEGILSKDYQSIAYSRVQDVQLNEKMEERMFNVGDLLIKTAGSSGAEVILTGLKNPESYQRLISNRANQDNDNGGVSTGSSNNSNFSTEDSGSSGSQQQSSASRGLDRGYLENELTRTNNELQRLNQRSNTQGLSESERERWYKLEGQREILNRMIDETEEESGGDFGSNFDSSFSSDF